ncbi:MAG: hypothetical protein ABI868_06950 [Acidobacteriota bacterium]
MAESFRTDGSRATESAAEPDRDAKIEQLLLAGLDHYFSAHYDQAINVWTRALFFDRSHPRARAYIERARSALAERQRESEELLHNGAAALDRGEGAEARRLWRAAIDGGARAEDASALFDRLKHQAAVDPIGLTSEPARIQLPAARPASTSRRPLSRAALAGLLATVVAAAGMAAYAFAGRRADDWRAAFARPGAAMPAAASAPVRDALLPLPRRGEMALGRARSLAAGGRLREALTVLESVRPADPQKAEADRLRADIQRQLLALASIPQRPGPAADGNASTARQP